MFSHSSLDDIDYNNLHRRRYSHASQQRLSKKRRHRRHGHGHSKICKSKHSFIKHYVADKCAVCLDDEKTLDTKLFPCGHQFHGHCLIQCVKTQKNGKFECPLCRQSISNFIQMTGNQQINDQLISLWNEHYLYKSHSGQSEESGKNIKKSVEYPIKPALAAQSESVSKSEPIALTTNCIESTSLSQNDSVCIEKESIKEKKSLWKFIWNSPYSLVQKYKTQSNLHLNALLHSMPFISDISYNEYTENEQIFQQQSLPNNEYHYDQMHFGLKPSPFLHKNSDANNDDLRFESVRNESSNVKIAASQSNDLLDFTSLNAESGILAGFAAGSTTFLLLNARMSMLRSSLFPILGETVPSVAIFFTSYEHLKKYLFNVDNVQNSYSYTFGQRFISAGIASSFASFLNGGNALLPMRFASFFGTFELCKDLMNKQHDQLNLFQVASSAAIGGTVAHNLYYPMAQTLNLSALATTSGSEVSKQVIGRQLFKGCVSSLTKFLPSCVVCSCAFEYSKRYLNK